MAKNRQTSVFKLFGFSLMQSALLVCMVK
jgi:hypothetical protein